ncbi:MAG: magnesium chelatase subunit ChlI family protein, partial [Caulobacteraceae bacterium]
VAAARAVQEVRGQINARLEGERLGEAARLDESGKGLLSRAAEAGHLTARGWTRTLRLARTIADLDGAEAVRRVHVAEALIYRRTGAGAEVAA